MNLPIHPSGGLRPAPLRSILTTLLLVPAFGGCSPAAPAAPSQADTTAQLQSSRNKTLTIGVRSEANTAAAKGLQTTGSNVSPETLFNAGLAQVDNNGLPHPYLAETLPQLNTDTWRVSADGRMETVYRLKPGLTWHDGTPMSAQDFAFALRVYSIPELGASNPSPQNVIDDVAATDDRTVLVRWQKPFAEAGSLIETQFQALPRHILEEPLQQLAPDAFAAHPFWTGAYVGLGAYRVEKWDPGVGLEASAFAGYVFGKPNIGRIRVVYIADSNTVLANLLAGGLDIAMANSLIFDQGLMLQREWDARGSAGIVHFYPSTGTTSRTTEFQLDPARVAPTFKGTLDVRVRRAMAHAIDKQGINDAVFESQGWMADTRILPGDAIFPHVDQAVSKYPFDLRQSAQLMSAVGFTRGTDGIYLSPDGLRFAGEDWITASAQSERTQAVMIATWKQAGFEIGSKELSTVEQRDARLRSERPGTYTGDGGGLDTLGTDAIPRPENRFTGSNRGSYASPEYDRLLGLWRGELDRDQRNQHLVQMARLSSQDLPSIPLHYNLQITAHVAALEGPSHEADGIATWVWRG